MNNRKFYIYTIVLILFGVFISSCKTAADVEIEKIWGRGVKAINQEKSSFTAFGRIINKKPGIEARIDGWGFKVYADDTMLFEINSDNYKNFDFTVSVSKPVNYMDGTLIIMVGLPYYDAYLDFVDIDVYKGQKPNKLFFSCTITDMSGNTTNLEGSSDFEFIEHEETN